MLVVHCIFVLSLPASHTYILCIYREIEFRLRFGCDVPTFLDQGVRFEVDDEDWSPIRFYTPSLVAPLGPDPLVQLLKNGSSVSAGTIAYTSSLPLLLLNDSETVTVREYLCEDYVSLLKRQGLRLRWMQRYRSDRNVDVATWYLDDINVRLWNGDCFLSVLSEDFSGGVSNDFRVQRGIVVEDPCGDEGEVLYFNGLRTTSNSVINRRSLVISMFNTSGSCGEVSDPGGECVRTDIFIKAC